MSTLRLISCVVLAMTAFAANSVLCRLALRNTAIDPASFTLIRIASGGFMLGAIVMMLHRVQPLRKGSWGSAVALLAYAAAFSFAYRSLSTGTGALILFGAVQLTMVGSGLWQGERLRLTQVLGLLLAAGGLVYLVLPGVDAPAPLGSVLMSVAGIAWGIYSLRGRGERHPTEATAGNFLRASSLSVVVLGLALPVTAVRFDGPGVVYAVLSGALASGLGYAVWYLVLPSLSATQGAVVQLSVPVLAAVGGIIFLAEPLSLRLGLAAGLTLSGIAWVLRVGKPTVPRGPPRELSSS